MKHDWKPMDDDGGTAEIKLGDLRIVYSAWAEGGGDLVVRHGDLVIYRSLHPARKSDSHADMLRAADKAVAAFSQWLNVQQLAVAAHVQASR